MTPTNLFPQRSNLRTRARFEPQTVTAERTAAPPRFLNEPLVLPSRFDVHTVPEFLKKLDGEMGSSPRRIVIDGRQVKHIDMAGLDALEAAEASGRTTVFPSVTLIVAAELTNRSALATSNRRAA